MPIYAFECDACGHSFDRLQKLSDADPTDCPQCGAARIRRQLTAPQFRLSGSGWYETDFKKDGDKKRNLSGDAGAGGDAKAQSKPGDGTSGDSKPGDTTNADSKSGDGKPVAIKSDPGKASDKPAVAKPTETKPAAKPASKPDS